jgi:hypothetical protein
MNRETAKAALAFIGRATLQASEIPAYQQVVLELQVVAQGGEATAPAGPELVEAG